LAQLPGRMPDAKAELQAALRIRSDPKLQQLVNRARGPK
jgi:hypothetical protein